VIARRRAGDRLRAGAQFRRRRHRLEPARRPACARRAGRAEVDHRPARQPRRAAGHRRHQPLRARRRRRARPRPRRQDRGPQRVRRDAAGAAADGAAHRQPHRVGLGGVRGGDAGVPRGVHHRRQDQRVRRLHGHRPARRWIIDRGHDAREPGPRDERAAERRRRRAGPGRRAHGRGHRRGPRPAARRRGRAPAGGLMAEALTLHLVRHGQTVWNVERRIQGQTHDVPLTEEGIAQARAAAAGLARLGAPLVLTSDLLRALQTAEIIAAATGAKLRRERAMRERHMGILQGNTAEDARRHYGERLNDLWSDPDVRFDGGESWRDVYARVAAFFHALRASPPAHELVLVTHGGTLNVINAVLAGEPVERLAWERIDNCAVRTVSLSRCPLPGYTRPMAFDPAYRTIFPRTAEVRGGRLRLGGCDAQDLVREFGSPLYVFDETELRETCRAYVRAFTSRYADTEVTYASKAYLSRWMATVAREEGIGLDVVSGGELAVALSAGFPAARVHFHGNNKGEGELREALDAGVGRIIVDNFHELELVDAIARARGTRQLIVLRLAPGVDAHTHAKTTTGTLDNKFGLPVATGAAEQAVVDALRLPNVDLVGLHCHLGSPLFDTAPYIEAHAVMLEFAARLRARHGFEMREYSPGGGFAAQYVRERP